MMLSSRVEWKLFHQLIYIGKHVLQLSIGRVYLPLLFPFSFFLRFFSSFLFQFVFQLLLLILPYNKIEMNYKKQKHPHLMIGVLKRSN